MPSWRPGLHPRPIPRPVLASQRPDLGPSLSVRMLTAGCRPGQPEKLEGWTSDCHFGAAAGLVSRTIDNQPAAGPSYQLPCFLSPAECVASQSRAASSERPVSARICAREREGLLHVPPGSRRRQFARSQARRKMNPRPQLPDSLFRGLVQLIDPQPGRLASVIIGEAVRGQGDLERIAQGLVLIVPFSQVVDQERKLIRG